MLSARRLESMLADAESELAYVSPFNGEARLWAQDVKALVEEAYRLREILAFYADPTSYHMPDDGQFEADEKGGSALLLEHPPGQKAREALG